MSVQLRSLVYSYCKTLRALPLDLSAAAFLFNCLVAPRHLAFDPRLDPRLEHEKCGIVCVEESRGAWQWWSTSELSKLKQLLFIMIIVCQ